MDQTFRNTNRASGVAKNKLKTELEKHEPNSRSYRNINHNLAARETYTAIKEQEQEELHDVRIPVFKSRHRTQRTESDITRNRTIKLIDCNGLARFLGSQSHWSSGSRSNPKPSSSLVRDSGTTSR